MVISQQPCDNYSVRFKVQEVVMAELMKRWLMRYVVH